MNQVRCTIRLLEGGDIPQIVQAFAELGWDKPRSQYERYLSEQEMDMRNAYVAFLDKQFAGYLTICWVSTYVPFQEAGIPEIVDLNVLPEFRRRGIGTLLMDRAESEIASAATQAGIGVGMTPDYGAAQRMYVLRGYVPDGRGLHYRGQQLRYGEAITIDDSLGLYLTKRLRQV
jgi:ribosomal protein S18 acetylase RimI-like enzyme